MSFGSQRSFGGIDGVEAEQVVAARVVDHAAHAGGQVVGIEHGEPAGLLRQVDERLLRVEQLPHALASGIDGVGGGAEARLQAARVHRVDDDAGAVGSIHHPRERRPRAARLLVADAEIEPFRDEHHALASGERLDAAQHVLEGAERAAGGHLVPQALDVQADIRNQRQARLGHGVEGADPLAALERPAHAIDGGVQQPAVGRELLQRADAAGGADDGHEVAGRDHRVDVARQHRPDVGGALERQAEIVDDDRQHPAGAVGGREPAAAGERPRRCHRVAGRAGRRWRCGYGRGALERRPAVRTDDVDVDRLPHGPRCAALDDLEVTGLQVGDMLPVAVDDDGVDGGEAGANTKGRFVRRCLWLLAGHDHAPAEQGEGRSYSHGKGGRRPAPAGRLERARTRHHRTSNSTHWLACGRRAPSGATDTCSV